MVFIEVPDNLTPEQLQRIDEIRKQYDEELARIDEQVKTARGRHRKELVSRRAEIELAVHAEVDNYVYNAQAERIKSLDTDDAIAEAVQVFNITIEPLYNDLAETYKREPEGSHALDKFITAEGDEVRLRSDFVFSLFDNGSGRPYKSVLNGDALLRYYAAIRDAIKGSPFTDGRDLADALVKTTPEEVRRFLPDSRRYSFMNDKVIHALFKADPQKVVVDNKDVTALFFGGEDLLRIAPNGQLEMLYRIDQKTKKAATTLISLTANADALSISKRTTAFHEVVHDTVYSIVRDALTIDPELKVPLFIPTEAIWRRMNGHELNDTRYKLPPAQRERIDNALAYLRNVDVFMDIRQEIDAGIIEKSKLEPVFIGGKNTARIVNADPSERIYIYNGAEVVVNGWTLKEVPLLGIYNEMKRHILTVPLDLLDTAEGGRRNDEKTIVFRNYLLAQIVLMQYGNRNTSILLSDLYEKTGTPTPEEAAERGEVSEAGIRKRRQKDNDVVEGILTAWVKKAWIKSYEPDKDGRGSIRGYKIDPNGERRFKIEGAEDTRKRLQKKPQKSDKSCV